MAKTLVKRLLISIFLMDLIAKIEIFNVTLRSG